MVVCYLQKFLLISEKAFGENALLGINGRPQSETESTEMVSHCVQKRNARKRLIFSSHHFAKHNTPTPKALRVQSHTQTGRNIFFVVHRHNVDTKRCVHRKARLYRAFLLPKRRFASAPKCRCQIAVFPLRIDSDKRKTE